MEEVQSDSKYSNHSKTLATTLNRLVVIVFLLVAFLGVGSIFAYSYFKQSIGQRSLRDSLIESSHTQIEALLPSLILPEQSAGIKVLLERFKKAEGLESIELLSPDASGVDRASSDDSKITVTFPIIESGKTYGTLVKSKRVDNYLAGDHVLPLIEFLTGALLLSFLLLFGMVSRLTAKEIPSDLQNLTVWIEEVLSGHSQSNRPQLKIAELNELGAKIGEIIQRHDQARDQAFIGQVTSGIMHDIKTPLQSMVGALGLVKKEPLDSSKRMSRLENLYMVCSKTLPVIGGIIESTLDGNREIHVEKTQDDVLNTVNDSIALHESSLVSRNIQVRIDCSDRSKARASHDPIQLGRVFNNLIKNSIDAFDEQGNENSSRTILFKFEEHDPKTLSLIFEDNGPGLPHNPESVFRVFRSKKLRGCGLGLVVSRKIVTAHQGTLAASRASVTGRNVGARFELSLPRM